MAEPVPEPTLTSLRLAEIVTAQLFKHSAFRDLVLVRIKESRKRGVLEELSTHMLGEVLAEKAKNQPDDMREILGFEEDTPLEPIDWFAVAVLAVRHEKTIQ
jgi:hypothetical protein